MATLRVQWDRDSHHWFIFQRDDDLEACPGKLSGHRPPSAMERVEDRVEAVIACNAWAGGLQRGYFDDVLSTNQRRRLLGAELLTDPRPQGDAMANGATHLLVMAVVRVACFWGIPAGALSQEGMSHDAC
jgi:hypothetical protein